MAVKGAIATAASVVPWAGFEGVVSTLCGDAVDVKALVLDRIADDTAEMTSRDAPVGSQVLLPGPVELVVDHCAAQRRHRTLWTALQASPLALALLPPLQRLVCAYAAAAVEVLVSDDNGIRAVDTQSGGTRTIVSAGRRAEVCSLWVDPSNASLLVGVRSAVWRCPYAPPTDTGDSASVAAAAAAGDDVRGAAWEHRELLAGAEDCERGDADGAAREARFWSPVLFHCSADGAEVLFADVRNNKVRRIDVPNSAVTTIAGSGAQGNTDGAATASAIDSPQGGVLDPLHTTTSAAEPADVLLVAGGCAAIRRLNRCTGVLSTTPLSDQRLEPSGLLATPSGWLMVSCTSTFAVYAVDARTGHTVLLAGAGRTAAEATASAAASTVVTGATPDDGGKCVRAAEAEASACVDGAALSVARFCSPYGLAAEWCAPSERLCAWVADTDAHRIRCVTLPPYLAQPPTA